MITTLQTARTRHVDARKRQQQQRQQQQQRDSIVARRVVDAAAQRATPTEIRRPGSRYRRLWYLSLKRTPSVATPTSSSPRKRSDTPDRGAKCELWQRRSSWKTLTGTPVSRRTAGRDVVLNTFGNLVPNNSERRRGCFHVFLHFTLDTIVLRSEVIRDSGASRGEGVFDEVDLLLWRRHVDKTSLVVSVVSEERESY